MNCVKCGASSYALFPGNLCSKCHKATTARKKTPKIDMVEDVEVKRRKPKSKHNVERNIELYILYTLSHPELKEFNKRDFERMGIPITSVNYLIKVLKRRGYIETVGQYGAYKFVATPRYRNLILVALKRIEMDIKAYNNEVKKSIREEKSSSSSGDKKG